MHLHGCALVGVCLGVFVHAGVYVHWCRCGGVCGEELCTGVDIPYPALPSLCSLLPILLSLTSSSSWVGWDINGDQRM